MVSFISLVAFMAVFLFCDAVKLPSYFKQCKKDNTLNDCIKESGNAGMFIYAKGDPAFHTPPLIPFNITEMFIDVEGGLKINMTNSVIYGLETAVLEKANWDWDQKKIFIDLSLDKAALIGTYDIDGKILILPIRGVGPCNITYVKPLCKFVFTYDIVEKKGKEYVSIIKSEMKYDVERAYYTLENLFDGDKRLGAEMAKFLDENWKEVNGEIGVRVGEALGNVFGEALKGFFSRVPLKHLFAE